MITRLTLATMLLAAASTAGAQSPVYRCGPEGREYSQLPCPGGTQFDPSDPRSAAQRAKAQQLAQAERRYAERLERERRANEAAVVPARAAGIDHRRAAPPQPAASKPTRSTRKKSSEALAPGEADFIAKNPPPPRRSTAP